MGAHQGAAKIIGKRNTKIDLSKSDNETASSRNRSQTGQSEISHEAVTQTREFSAGFPRKRLAKVRLNFEDFG